MSQSQPQSSTSRPNCSPKPVITYTKNGLDNMIPTTEDVSGGWHVMIESVHQKRQNNDFVQRRFNRKNSPANRGKCRAASFSASSKTSTPLWVSENLQPLPTMSPKSFRRELRHRQTRSESYRTSPTSWLPQHPFSRPLSPLRCASLPPLSSLSPQALVSNVSSTSSQTMGLNLVVTGGFAGKPVDWGFICGLLSGCGKVRMHPSRTHGHYGFVWFDNSEDAVKAITYLNGFILPNGFLLTLREEMKTNPRMATDMRPDPDTFPGGCQHPWDNSQNQLIYNERLHCLQSADVNPFIRTKKSLNVDSPSFTPTTLASSGTGATMSSRAANAAPFTPRGAASGTATPNTQTEDQVVFNPAQIREFTPQSYDLSAVPTLNGAAIDGQIPYDPFMSNATQPVSSTQFNPYLEDNGNLVAATGNAYYPTQATYAAPAQPVQYHLYAPIGPHREDLLAYQRLPHDFFMTEKLREEMQRKSEASLQTMPNSQLPALEHYHSLVALDTNHHKSATAFTFPSWVYKATSSKNGNLYCLRRLEGYRLTNEKAIRSVKEWRRVNNGGVVTVIDAFTTRAFGDSSLIVVTDYHPLSKTLVETHFTGSNRYGSRQPSSVSEPVLWGYIVQIASAIKSVHASGLAVRCLEPSKVIVTDKNRVRLSACSVLDVVLYDSQRPLPDLQQEDLQLFGKLILILATNNLTAHQNMKVSIDTLGRLYTAELRDTVVWLLAPAQPSASKTIDDLLRGISGHVVTTLDSSLHEADTLTSELSKELENGRIARLMLKLGTINERPEYEGDRNWSENGERYMLKLFRDYVFHQVDAAGNPVLSMAHMLSCLNKLDAGVDEKVLLTSRDEQSTMVVSYKELKKQVSNAFADLNKTVKPNRGY